MEKFDFDDINLIPKKGIVDSRSEIDTKTKLGNFEFKLPVIPANMECVIDDNIAEILASNGYFYIMHRFGLNAVDFIRKMKSKNLLSSISLGVNQDSYDTIDEIVTSNNTPDFVTIDIAHGHSIKMEKMLKYIKEKLPNTFVIAGNVSTPTAVMELEIWGADAVKVGIGPGCFIPTSEVKTIEGLKSLQNILIGDSVLTHKNRYKRVIDKHIYYGEQELLKINNLPPCTETHEFYVIEKSKRELVNDENLSEFAFWVKAKELDKDKHLLIKCE
jgi:IMP dehydrogenase/GMP reductase